MKITVFTHEAETAVMAMFSAFGQHSRPSGKNPTNCALSRTIDKYVYVYVQLMADCISLLFFTHYYAFNLQLLIDGNGD